MKSFGRVRNVFGTCVGVALRQPRIKWSYNRHGARHLVFYHLFHTHTLTLARLLPSSRTNSIVCSHASCPLLLARFLSASPTHSVAYLFSVFFPPSLPPSFTNSLVCLLPPSFLPLIARLILTFHCHSLTHSHTLSCFFTS